jgi:hypothetical protein
VLQTYEVAANDLSTGITLKARGSAGWCQGLSLTRRGASARLPAEIT